MNINSTISIYEIIATALAVIAIAQPWFIKLYKCIFKKFKLSFISPKNITLFYNRSGAYVYIDGVIESKNKSVVVRDIEVKIVRENDKAELHLDWSTFRAPVFQQIGSNSVITNEIAHPFFIMKDALVPVYTEFAISNQEDIDRLERLYNEVEHKIIQEMNLNSEYEKVKDEFLKSPLYQSKKEILLQDFYWKEGTYYLDFIVTFDDTNKKSFRFYFALTKGDFDKLKSNIENSLLSSLNLKFGKPLSLFTIKKEIYQKKEICNW